MDPPLYQLVHALHQTGRRCALVLAGGGSGAAAALLAVPRASRTILDVSIPYGQQALVDYLGARPESYCSADAARALAQRAYDHATWLHATTDVVGLGCTATLVTDRPKRGDHRAFVSSCTSMEKLVYSLVLRKGSRDREQEDDVVSRLVLNVLAESFGIAERLDPLLLADEAISLQPTPSPQPLAHQLRGNVPAVHVAADGRISHEIPTAPVLLPGSFNPLHDGHWGLATVARRRTQRPVLFELSITNVDKPPLDPSEIRRRLAQFSWRAQVCLTRAPTFVDKASLFPGAVFVIGSDTAVRLVAPRYYNDSEPAMHQALNRIRALGCRFIVACRHTETGCLLHLADVDIPEPFRDLFEEILSSEFSHNVSSTQIRQN